MKNDMFITDRSTTIQTGDVVHSTTLGFVE